MVRTAAIYLASVLLALCGAVLFADNATELEYQDILLSEIASDIASYKGKEVTLRLKLKYMDHVFNRLVFYDRKNTDLELDVEKNIRDKKMAANFLNLHNGMEYLVTFRVMDVGKMGLVLAELKDFTPVALIRLPDGGR